MPSSIASDTVVAVQERVDPRHHVRRPSVQVVRGGRVERDPQGRLAYYEKELIRLQVELVKQQEYIRARGLRVVVFEGREAMRAAFG